MSARAILLGAAALALVAPRAHTQVRIGAATIAAPRATRPARPAVRPLGGAELLSLYRASVEGKAATARAQDLGSGTATATFSLDPMHLTYASASWGGQNVDAGIGLLAGSTYPDGATASRWYLDHMLLPEGVASSVVMMASPLPAGWYLFSVRLNDTGNGAGTVQLSVIDNAGSLTGTPLTTCPRAGRTMDAQRNFLCMGTLQLTSPGMRMFVASMIDGMQAEVLDVSLVRVGP